MSYKAIILLASVTALLIFLICFIFVETEQPFVVKGCSWTRTIDIEKNTLCTEEGWYVPYGGEVITSWTEIRGYDRISMGEDSNGNEQYISVPDYDTKYRYRIWRYLYERTALARGLKEAGEAPAWPNVVLGDKERQGLRREEYIVHLDRPFRTTLDQWQEVEKGFIVLGHKNMFGGLRRIDLLETI